MKHMHMLMAFITIALFLWQSYLVLAKGERFVDFLPSLNRGDSYS